MNLDFYIKIFHDWNWVVQAFGVIFSALVLDFIQRRMVKRMKVKVADKTRTQWDDAFFASLKGPLSLLIWGQGFAFALEVARQKSDAPLYTLISPLKDMGVIAAFGWFLVLLVKNGEEAYLKSEEKGEQRLDRATVHAIGKLMRMSVFFTAVLVGLQTMGYSISGVLAFGGIGGIAVGFAAKDLLSNLFGGLMIYLDRPFSVGDWVRSPDRKIEGIVEAISWRLTRIRTFDKRPLYVPNAMFSSIVVENPSRMTHRRIYETIGIRYDDGNKMGEIVKAVKEMLKKHPEINDSLTLIVNFNSFAPSSLDFFIYAFTHTTNWVRFHEIKEEVLLKIMRIISEQGAEIAFRKSVV